MKKYFLFKEIIKDQSSSINREIRINNDRKNIIIIIGKNTPQIHYANFINIVASINSNSSIFISRCDSCYNYKNNEKVNINKQKYDITIFLMDINEIIFFIFSKKMVSSKLGYKIAYIDWDLNFIPNYYNYFFDMIDEIWATNSIAYSAIKKISSNINLFNFPPFFKGISIPQKAYKESYVNSCFEKNPIIENKNYIFYTEVDFDDSYDKNNLKGALSSFINAFPVNKKFQKEKNVYFKIIFKRKDFNKYELQYLINNYSLNPRIQFMEFDSFNKIDISYFNCYVSLHRSCGFNSQIMQAFQFCQSIIHTSWGGHLDYCDGINSYPIGYCLKQISPKSYKYWPCQVWAEPDLKEASKIMKRLVKEYRNNINNKIIDNNIFDIKGYLQHHLIKRLEVILKI